MSNYGDDTHDSGYDRSSVIYIDEDIEEEDPALEAGLLESPAFVHNHQPKDSIPTNTFKQPPDLKFLASTNFSSDSINDNTADYSPSMSYSTIGVPIHNRRYSNSSLSNSPILKPSASSQVRNGGSRPRPKSAIFLMESSRYGLSEDANSPIHSPIQNTPGNRNSVHLPGKSSYSTLGNFPPTSSTVRTASPSRSSSPTRVGRAYRAKSPVRRTSSPTRYQPFNFKPQEMMLHGNGSNSSLTVKPAHRKGHKYKHSSVSMNLFQEPSPSEISLNKQQNAIPDLYPIPNLNESINSIKPEQKVKLAWSIGHFFLSILVFGVGYHFKLPAFSTLSHLVFYDSLGSLIIVFVDIMSNFEVWNKLSIAYPFGLGRLEVLAGFALSASLVMVGCDLVSHFVEELVLVLVVSDSDIDHESELHLSHHIHAEEGAETNWVVYGIMLLLVISMTLITSRFVLAHDRINQMISSGEEVNNKVSSKINSLKKGGLLDKSKSSFQSESESATVKLQRLSNLLSKNPTRLLTLLYTTYLVVLPLIPASFKAELGVDIDKATTSVVASLLCYNGWKLIKSLGGILLLSYPHSDYDYNVLKSSIIDQILSLDSYKNSYNIDNIFITKFNYELYIVGLKMNMGNASVDEESRLRFEVNRLIKSSIEATESFSARPSHIETTIDITRGWS